MVNPINIKNSNINQPTTTPIYPSIIENDKDNPTFNKIALHPILQYQQSSQIGLEKQARNINSLPK